MSAPPTFYPLSPRGVPQELIEPGPLFRRHVNLVIASLILFFLVYLSLLLIAAILAIVALRSSWPTAIRIAGCVFLAVVVLYLVKNLFRRRSPIKGSEVRIERDDYPLLFDFIERVCEETDAPEPDEVYVNFDVNAAAGADISLVGLFLKPRLRLILGFGLINVINLTEFKALLAHEFGHLSQYRQTSVPYVRMAMMIVATIIGGRDFLDRALEAWYAGPLSWLIAPAYWVVRGMNFVLTHTFVLVLKLQYTLLREMEFHADLVAVSVTGSDAVCSLLYKSYWGQECFEQMLLDLATAADHRLYTVDAFFHQRRAGKHLRKLREDPYRGEPPALPANRDQTIQLFADEDEGQAGMWDDHPTNYDREDNAKTYYIRTDYDERSPWILFKDSEDLRERVTLRLYRDLLDVPKKLMVSEPREVQRFIDTEHEEASFDAKYGGYFDQRFLHVFNVKDSICREGEGLNTFEHLVGNHCGLFDDHVQRFSESMNRHFEEEWLLRGLARGYLRLKRNRFGFEFRGERYPKKAARRLLKQVEKELDADLKWADEFDRKSFITYHELARQLNPAWAVELQERYRFHFVLIRMWKTIRAEEGYVREATEILISSGGEVESQLFFAILGCFMNAHHALKAVLNDSTEYTFPDLPNMPAGEPLRDFLLDKKLLPSLRRTWKTGDWIKKFLSQFHQVNRKLRRLHTKSLAGLLKLRETIGDAGLRHWESSN
jgi:Zn-dependent protease with chaperone function